MLDTVGQGVILLGIMNPRRWILAAISLALGAGLSTLPGCSKSDQTPAVSTPAAPATAAAPSAPQVPANGKSATVTTIASHLEFGGEFYAVVDVKGDLEKYFGAFGNIITSTLQQAASQAQSPELSAVAKLNIKELFSRLGLFDADGLGLSSWQGPDGLHHNRAFLYTPRGRTGLLKIFGGASGPFVTPSLAPADTDLVMESTMDFKAVADLVLSYVRDIGGPEAAAQVSANLKQEVVPGLSGQVLIDHLNTRLIVIARANTQKDIQVTPEIKIPTIDLLIALDGFSEIFDKLAPTLQSMGMFKFADKNGMQTATLQMQFPGPYSSYQPMLVSDPKSKRLYLVTNPAFADATIFGQGPRLSTSPDFKLATEGLPMQGNSLSYMSKHAGEAFDTYYSKQITSQLPAATRDSIMALNSMGNLPHGLAGTQSNLADGILVQGVANQSYKAIVMVAPVVAVGLVSAMAIPAFSKVREQSREKAIENNLRQIASASLTYMLDKGVTEVRYPDLIGGAKPYLQPLTPVAGESYDNIVVRQTTTRISVTMSDGTVVSYDL